jgi:hypothetical protein
MPQATSPPLRKHRCGCAIRVVSRMARPVTNSEYRIRRGPVPAGSIVNGIGLDGPLVRTLATTVTLCNPTGGLRRVNKLWFYTPSGGSHHPRGAVVTTNIVFMLRVGGAGGWFVGRWRAENARARFDQQKTWDARKTIASLTRRSFSLLLRAWQQSSPKAAPPLCCRARKA